jgi:hypothetical protein
MDKVKIISVHYKTPELIYNQYESVRKYYPKIRYEIVDGSDDKIEYFKDLEKKDSNFKVERFGYNIHHGPGMHHSIKNSKFKYLLILDSDVSIKEPFIESMFSNFDGIAKGMKIMVNKEGVSSKQANRTTDKNFIYPYVHPYCMLIDRDKYLNHKPFRKHGAPCIDFMMDVFDKGYSDELINFDIESYVNLVVRGTRSKWGINL